jgi:hypothetical protein
VFVAAGGMTLALVGALLTAGFGSQTFYPREGSVGMWCAIGLLLRVERERSRALAEGAPVLAPRARPAPGSRAATSAVRRPEARPAAASLDDRLWARAS